jgi:4-hydroxy-tetrahydrodipicolinate synthase
VLTGSFVAMVTPLTADRGLDEGGIEALVRRAIDDGASGVLTCGSTGEGTLLDPAHRVAVTARARAALPAGDGTLLACASAPNVAALHADVDRVTAAGADAVLVLAPAIQPLVPDELADLHLEVAERASVPTLVYHIPQFTNSSLTPEAVRVLAGHERIVGMKDSSPDAERRAAFVAATRDTAAVVLTGHAPTLQAALEAGAAGSITAIANVRQRQVVALHAAVAAGDEVAAGRAQDGLRRASDGIGRVGSSVPAVLKAALQLEGVLDERWCVPPLRSVPPTRLDHVRTALLA